MQKTRIFVLESATLYDAIKALCLTERCDATAMPFCPSEIPAWQIFLGKNSAHTTSFMGGPLCNAQQRANYICTIQERERRRKGKKCDWHHQSKKGGAGTPLSDGWVETIWKSSWCLARRPVRRWPQRSCCAEPASTCHHWASSI